ncbi:DUF2125 domain-containing protein [Pseudoponticoccus marisrubri]|uniref:DUF2125 domain-containing protein n=1 Tax=Pseudoponticoccus marisrubri TaxID=1685382 RepID=A0A0W7WGT8_9RHOB|nr:DUF2125 domain-containing protein [Pseudoponticoccus marisrubri]KUF09716.1 hypothetical protein AVJ23_16315 [Pseudoponticoccus marisrubri]
MKRWIALAVVAALAWSGWWAWSARALRGDLDRWVTALETAGWQVAIEDTRLRGFPSRLDLTLEGIDVTGPDGRLRWQAPFLQVLGLTYKPGHKILALPDTQMVTWDRTELPIAATGLRASVIYDGDRALRRANLEAETLTLPGPDGDLRLDGLRLAAARQGAEILAGLEAGLEGAPTPRLSLQLAARFEGTWSLDSPSGVLPRLDRLDVRQAGVTGPQAQVDADGLLRFDPRAHGALELQSPDWGAALEMLAEAGLLGADGRAALAAAVTEGPLTVTVEGDAFRTGDRALGRLSLR